MTEHTDKMLADTLRVLYHFTNNRCSVAAIKWRIGVANRDDADQIMLAIRDELTSLQLIGWSYPPKGPAEFFLSEKGKDYLDGLIKKNVPEAVE